MGIKKVLKKFGCVSAPAVASEDVQPHQDLSKNYRTVVESGFDGIEKGSIVESRADGKPYAMRQNAVSDVPFAVRSTTLADVQKLATLPLHPHVAKCKEAWFDGRNICLVSELTPSNRSLADYIKDHHSRRVPVCEEEIWTMFTQIARGVKHLHKHGIAHKDLRPENLLFDDEGRIKVANLGMPRMVKAGAKVKAQFGESHYLAPEVWRQGTQSFPADVWALGCILYEICNGEPCFRGKDDPSTESMVMAGYVPPISKRYSQELRDLIETMLQYRCSDRATIDAVLFIIRQHKNFYIEEHTITEADAAASTDVAMAATALTPHHSYRRYSLNDALVDLGDLRKPQQAQQPALQAQRQEAPSQPQAPAPPTPAVPSSPAAIAAAAAASGRRTSKSSSGEISVTDSAYDAAGTVHVVPSGKEGCVITLAYKSSLYTPLAYNPRQSLSPPRRSLCCNFELGARKHEAGQPLDPAVGAHEHERVHGFAMARVPSRPSMQYVYESRDATATQTEQTAAIANATS